MVSHLLRQPMNMTVTIVQLLFINLLLIVFLCSQHIPWLFSILQSVSYYTLALVEELSGSILQHTLRSEHYMLTIYCNASHGN